MTKLGTDGHAPWENRTTAATAARDRGEISYPLVGAWLNQTYSIQRLEHPTHPGIVHMIVRRHDEGTVFPWRDLQSIKDYFGGPEAWAIEMFPPRDAVVDNRNLRHLWVMRSGWEPPIDLRQVKT